MLHPANPIGEVTKNGQGKNSKSRDKEIMIPSSDSSSSHSDPEIQKTIIGNLGYIRIRTGSQLPMARKSHAATLSPEF